MFLIVGLGAVFLQGGKHPAAPDMMAVQDRQHIRAVPLVLPVHKHRSVPVGRLVCQMI